MTPQLTSGAKILWCKCWLSASCPDGSPPAQWTPAFALQAAAYAGPPAAAVWREEAALPVPPVRATDLWGALWWLQGGAERYVSPPSPPCELLVLAKTSGEVFTVGVPEIWETYFLLSEKAQSLRIPVRRGERSHTKPRCWWQEQDSAYRSLKIGYKSQTSPTWMV